MTSDALRDYIRNSELRQGEIARRANMTDANLSKFLSGKQGITLATADNLCDVLGLILVPRKVYHMLMVLTGLIDPAPVADTGQGRRSGLTERDLESIRRLGETMSREAETEPESTKSKLKHP